ncbi:cache domain-containing sensor histidine kinase [Christensenella intestinihominis]|uniref:cache domain-containing sensor histidine kinase n=1 Tax=Christensenella intestinihominis TaxID=1851429 RepID=UPI00082A80D3|nr:sensor histidine kinase [Christensenella intestinihominis]
MSFKIKTFFVIFLAILLPAIITNLLIYTQAENSVVNQTAAGVITGMDKAMSSFDSSLKALVSLSKRMQNDNGFILSVEQANRASEAEKNTAYAELYTKLNSFLESIKAPNIVQDIDSLYLFLPGRNTVITTNTTYYEGVDHENISFLEHELESPGAGEWYVSSPINFDTLQGRPVDETLLTYNQSLYNEAGEVIGIYALNLKSSVFRTAYNDTMLNVPGGMAVYDAGGKLLSRNNLPDLTDSSLLRIEKDIEARLPDGPRPYFMTNEGGNEYLVVTDRSSNTGWTYTTILETTDFLGGLYETKKLLILIIVMMAIATPVISIIISRSIIKPTEKLVYAMQEIQNRNLDIRINEPRKDEYQKVFQGFNDMVIELNELIRNLTNEKALNKEAKIRLLQEQINPHFLYNTLDSIYSIAQLHDVPEISKMVFALSQFFRVSLSGGKEIVRLEEALEIVKSYLTVQNIRFNGKFRFSLSVPEELLDCKVLKLLLQPLAENAVYHGLEAKKGEGTINITAHEDGGTLQICVEDNGVGIPAAKLEEIRKALRDNNMEESGNFAIKNLNTQIQLRYGKNYGLDIYSEENVGTGVFIKIPVVR